MDCRRVQICVRMQALKALRPPHNSHAVHHSRLTRRGPSARNDSVAPCVIWLASHMLEDIADAYGSYAVAESW